MAVILVAVLMQEAASAGLEPAGEVVLVQRFTIYSDILLNTSHRAPARPDNSGAQSPPIRRRGWRFTSITSSFLHPWAHQKPKICWMQALSRARRIHTLVRARRTDDSSSRAGFWSCYGSTMNVRHSHRSRRLPNFGIGGPSAAGLPIRLAYVSRLADGADSILPFPSWAYRPGYLSGERRILFADNLPLSEPEVFVLSWPQVQSSPKTEPMRHPLGLCEMRSVSVGLPDPTSISSSLRAIRDAGLVKIHHSATPELVIEFTSQKEVQHSVPALGLSMVGRCGS